ncbi:MAG: CHAP domain-containing protein [Deltaproteobacteria bacterium]|nr:CHAP domain-containing protein [Deltaproteobacteria bacterium]
MRLAPLPLMALLLLSSACAAPGPLALRRSAMIAVPSGPLTPEGRPSPIPSFASASGRGAVDGEAIAATAREYVGKRSVSGGGKYPEDCTGLVRAVYGRHGMDLLEGSEAGDSGVQAIWRFAQRHGELHRDHPRAGDVVFFSETYDRNRDGRENDGLTHVGIVESVEQDGTVRVIHRVANGVVSYRMNLGSPRQRADGRGRVVNDWLRAGKSSRLAGELFAGFATVARR